MQPQFIVVSGKTLDRGFDYVYKQLVVNSPSTSKFCFADSRIGMRARDLGIVGWYWGCKPKSLGHVSPFSSPSILHNEQRRDIVMGSLRRMQERTANVAKTPKIEDSTMALMDKF